jgi:hypothetical protein
VNLFRGVWLYDHEKNEWRQVNQEGGGNAAYCYDPGRDRIYQVTGKSAPGPGGTWVPVPDSNTLREYDIAANTWITPKTEGSAGGGMESARAFFTFDTANDAAVLHIDDRHHVYDPRARKWTTLPATIPEKVPHWGASSGFYDPETNAHFYFNAGDSSTEPGNMWAWRYARGGGR